MQGDGHRRLLVEFRLLLDQVPQQTVDVHRNRVRPGGPGEG